MDFPDCKHKVVEMTIPVFAPCFHIGTVIDTSVNLVGFRQLLLFAFKRVDYKSPLECAWLPLPANQNYFSSNNTLH